MNWNMPCSLEEATGLAFRFITSKTNDKSKMVELRKEVAEYDDFIQLDNEEEYSKLPYKTLVLTIIKWIYSVLFTLLLQNQIFLCFLLQVIFLYRVSYGQLKQ
jgi:hypothetical protein